LLAGIFVLSLLDLSGDAAGGLFLLVAAILVAIAKRKGHLLSPVMLIALAYVLAYPLEALLGELFADPRPIAPETLDFGVLWALRGFCAFAVGYSLALPLVRGPKPSAWRDANWIRGRIGYTVYILTAIGWLTVLAWTLSVALFGIALTFVEGDAVSAESSTGTFRMVLELLLSLRYPFLFGFLLLYYWRMTDRQLNIVCFLLVAISVIEIITIGSKGSIIRGIVIVVLTASVLPIKLNLKQMVIAMTALIAVYGSFLVTTEYRSLILADHEAGRNVFDVTVQAEAFKGALWASLPFSGAGATRETKVAAEDVFRRLSHATTFSNLLEHTGRESPGEHAWESFLAPVYGFLPRFLVPGKPVFFDSGRNASEYYGWRYGGISVTLLGSFYYAWGYAGIVIGMACTGGWLAYVERKAQQGSIFAPHWLILLVITFLMLMDVGITFQPIVTNLVRVVLVLMLLRFFYSLLQEAFRKRASRIVAAAQRRVRA
jgi:hypothetical protein